MKNLIIALLLLLMTTACSTLKTTVRPNVDWSSLSRVEVAITDDRWNLLPQLSTKLADQGYSIVPSSTGTADLQATLQVTDSSTLSESGATVAWPRDLTLQLLDAKTGAELARSRYQLAPTQQPKQALTLMVNDLRKKTSKTIGAAPGRQPLGNSTATAPEQSAPQPTPVETSPPPVTTDTNHPSEPAAAITAPGSSQSREELSEPETTDSDWIPRFKGWQFRGDDTTADEVY